MLTFNQLFDPIVFGETFCTYENQPVRFYEYQKNWLRDKSRFRIAVKSRQVGMSWICAYEALHSALFNKAQTVLFVSMSERQAEELMRHVEIFHDELPKQVQVVKDGKIVDVLLPRLVRDKKSVKEFSNKSRIVVLPNNPDTVRGYKANWVYWDEAGKFPNDEEMNNALAPTTIRAGRFSILSTLRGKRGVFWNFASKAGFVEGETVKPPQPDNVFSLHTVPWWKCPHVSKDIELYKRQMGGENSIGFREEFCCVPVDESISVFPLSLLESAYMLWTKHRFKLNHSPTIVTKNPLYVGLDIGRVADATVLIMVEKTPEFRSVLRFYREWVATPLPEQFQQVVSILQQASFTRCFVDRIGPGMKMAEDLTKVFGSKIDEVNLTSEVKEKLVIETMTLFQDHQAVIPPPTYVGEDGVIHKDYNAEKLINQLHSVERQITKAGNIRYGHPEGTHDDWAWAYMLANMGATMPVGVHGVLTVAWEQVKVRGLEEWKKELPLAAA